MLHAKPQSTSYDRPCLVFFFGNFEQDILFWVISNKIFDEIVVVCSQILFLCFYFKLDYIS